VAEWRHDRDRWELGWWDEPRRQEFTAFAWVTDEFIARTDPPMAAATVHRRLGTIPPPLTGYLPQEGHADG